MATPSQPSSAIRRQSASEWRPSLRARWITSGGHSFLTNSRTACRSCICSSVRSKFTGRSSSWVFRSWARRGLAERRDRVDGGLALEPPDQIRGEGLGDLLGGAAPRGAVPLGDPVPRPEQGEAHELRIARDEDAIAHAARDDLAELALVLIPPRDHLALMGGRQRPVLDEDDAPPQLIHDALDVAGQREPELLVRRRGVLPSP